MRKLVLSLLITGACAGTGYAQTLFTYGGHPVTKEEFLKVYKKNSMNKTPDMSDTALKSYLDLYALFRMKVAEADKEKLDTVQTINQELDNYRKQLAKNYLTDEQVTNKLIHEAYDRMKEDVRIEHILISCPPGSDTTAAYKRIDSIYNAIEHGAQFEAMAKEFSDDKGSRDNGGDIGYFSALQTLYAFENVAYGTPVGKMSKPFHTQFGYHIMKVLDKRADRGQVKVAQIMIAAPKSRGEEGIAAAKLRADTVETMLKNGASFESLVSKYSDDQYSVKDGGVLKPFGAGHMVMAFENAAFALNKPGDVSAPVKTDYGYHIIKLIAKLPLAPYDTLFPQLKHKVENDSRSQTAKEHFFNKIKEKNGFKEYPANLKEVADRVMATPDTGKMAKMISGTEFNNMTKPVFALAGKNYLQSDFGHYMATLTHGKLNGPKNIVVHDAYNMYVNSVVNDFEEHKLVEENPEFKALMEEYRDGIMLFELMDRNVWSKAAHDTVGLTAFYEKHKNKYMWEAGFEGSVYKFKTRALLDSGMTLVNMHTMSDEEIAKAMNTSAHSDAVSIQHGHFEFSHFKDATLADLAQNKTHIVPSSGAPFEAVVAKEVYNGPTQKSLADARGYVVAEYQDFLEKQWNEKMRRDYPLKVNDPVFKTMVAKGKK